MTALHSADYQRLVQGLVLARGQRGLTQRQLGELLGRDHTYITKYETRVRRLDVIEFVEIMDALGIDPGDFLRKILPRRS